MSNFKNYLQLFILVILLFSCNPKGVEVKVEVSTDATTPLHLLQPDYPTLYGTTTPDDIKVVIKRVAEYLENTTPSIIIDETTGKEITDFSVPNDNAQFESGDFRMVSYEWGVTYAGMMNANKATGEKLYNDYVQKRFQLLADVYPKYEKQYEANEEAHTPIRSVVKPHALDDAGAMCAAMVKAQRADLNEGLQPMIDNYIDYIMNKEFRLEDGTLARNRPLPNTIWLDDLFMSIPALAQKGKQSDDMVYFDEAVKQVLQFANRMFVIEKGLFMHGWVQDMEPHPVFHWARANGWAFMTMAELLDVLPKSHKGYNDVLELFQAHAKGLAAYQDGTGFWHQLIDKNDSYLETSATAIYTYCYAKGINNGWLDAKAYGPVSLLAWNAVTTKVNDKGQVEGTCVGTGMGFDPAFYYHRPINVYAAHGYGPVLLAGSEMILMIQSHPFTINDSAVMF